MGVPGCLLGSSVGPGECCPGSLTSTHTEAALLGQGETRPSPAAPRGGSVARSHVVMTQAREAPGRGL